MIRFDSEVMLDKIGTKLILDVPRPDLVPDEDLDGVIPSELRSWLLQLRLLHAVPFAYLVPDTMLLPEESIRWFYLDRRWTDVLVQGALSVGTANSDDRAHLTAQYPAIREELDVEERNLRRRSGGPRVTGGGGAISGFVMRSKAVSGWPGLHVRAFDVEPDAGDDARHLDDADERIALLRLERLAPAVLLCLFDGIPKVVHIEEPRHGVQFGLLETETAGGQVSATIQPRDASPTGQGKDLDHDVVPVQFRAGASGVIDFKQLEADLRPIVGTGAGDAKGLDSAELALQLVRFPYRQIWGGRDPEGLVKAFAPTVGYAAMTRVFRQERT